MTTEPQESPYQAWRREHGEQAPDKREPWAAGVARELRNADRYRQETGMDLRRFVKMLQDTQDSP